MQLREITKAILVAVVNLHRAAIIRTVAQADASVESSFNAIRAQNAVIAQEQEIKRHLTINHGDIARKANEVREAAVKELDDLPEFNV